jgi:hypothetical protein
MTRLETAKSRSQDNVLEAEGSGIDRFALDPAASQEGI